MRVQCKGCGRLKCLPAPLHDGSGCLQKPSRRRARRSCRQGVQTPCPGQLFQPCCRSLSHVCNHVQALLLSNSKDLVCSNLLCEKVSACSLSSAANWQQVLPCSLCACVTSATTNAQALLVHQVGDPCICRLARVLERCQHLQELDLSHNRLTAVPGSAELLPQLRKLNVSHNKLVHVPGFLAEMPALQVWCTSHNDAIPGLPCCRQPSAGHEAWSLSLLVHGGWCSQELDIRSNPLQDLSVLHRLPPSIHVTVA